jgi:hypothetical protein
MSPHDSSSLVPPTASPTRYTSCVSPFISNPTPKEIPYPSEHVSEDVSEPDDDLSTEDDLSPIRNALIVSSINNYTCFHHQSDICFSPDDPNPSKPH